MIEYLACGNVMSDVIEYEDGSTSQESMGGPAMFALAGIRIWTEKCKLVAQTGSDYIHTYGKWMDRHGLTHESILVEVEEVPRFTLRYRSADKGFEYISHKGQEHLGYLKTHAYHIDQAATSSVKGIYMAQNLDRVVWANLRKVKESHGFKMMWEIEYPSVVYSKSENLARIAYVLQIVEMWSINHNEASDLFEIPREDDAAIINELRKLPAQFTLYRVGERGAYAVTPQKVYYCPSISPSGEQVDPTGCGNNSTGAAMYAWTEGYHPAMVVAMANVSAGYNAAQHGPYLEFTAEVMAQAKGLALHYKENVVKDYTDYI